MLLRCKGKSGVQVKGRYAPGINETCIKGRDLCVGDIIDFWLLTKDNAIPSDLLGKNYERSPHFGMGPIEFVLYFDKKTGSTLQINPTTGQYHFTADYSGNEMKRIGICEQFSDKKLFKR